MTAAGAPQWRQRGTRLPASGAPSVKRPWNWVRPARPGMES
jgi:hypothetical protein